MNTLPLELLEFLPPLLDRADVAQLMRSARRFYPPCCRHLYASVTVKFPCNWQQSKSTRQDDALLATLEDKNLSTPCEEVSLRPHHWIRHLTVHWPPHTDYGTRLIPILRKTTSLLSLELVCNSPSSWKDGLADLAGPGKPIDFLPALTALKTNDIEDARRLAHGRHLQSLFVGRDLSCTPLEFPPESTVDLLGTLNAYSSQTLRHLQLEVVGDPPSMKPCESGNTIFDIFRGLHMFQNLEVFTLVFTSDTEETPDLASFCWGAIKDCAAILKAKDTRVSQSLYAFSLILHPSPSNKDKRNIRDIILEFRQCCVTLRHIEFQWTRWDQEEEGKDGVFTDIIMRGQGGTLREVWAYHPRPPV